MIAIKMRGLCDDEKLIAVHVQFRHLMTIGGIFNGKGMQTVIGLERREFFSRGLCYT